MKKKRIYIAIYSLALLTSGCSDFLSEYSQDMVIPKTIADLDEVLIGEVYMQSYEIQNGASSSSCGFFNILDDDINTAGPSSDKDAGNAKYVYGVDNMFGYYAWQQDVRYNYLRSSALEDNATWNDLYHRINVVNVILDEIEGLPHTTDNDQAAYLRVKGESYFLRGQFYFILANLYGDAYAPSTCSTKLCVPLKLTAYVEYDKEADTQFQRATVEAVYAQVVSDLLEAEKYLTDSPQNERHRLHRATWEAVDILLSRVYLYMQDWENAEKKAEKVMKSDNFLLASIAGLTNGEAFLVPENSEVVFSQGTNYIACSDPTWSVYATPSDYCVTRELYDMYEEKDARKSCFFSVTPLIEGNVQKDSVALSKKYQRGLAQGHISDALALRVSEAYLNYAEACAMQSGKDAAANNALYQLRMQRIADYERSTYTGKELVTQIRDERRRELCFEGKRWFDLRRYAVCETYPYSRDIVHVFQRYADNFAYLTPMYYKLPAGDPAYTFGIPRKVLDADKVPMVDNLREKREPLEIEEGPEE